MANSEIFKEKLCACPTYFCDYFQEFRTSKFKFCSDKTCLPSGPKCNYKTKPSICFSKILNENKTSACKKKPSVGCINSINKSNPPKFLSQPQNRYFREDNSKPMGPIGPWATGKVELNASGGLVGIRPVVNRLSITRSNEVEWQKRNYEIFEQSAASDKINLQNEGDTRKLIEECKRKYKKDQAESKKLLEERKQQMVEREDTVRKAIERMIEEIEVLDEGKVRLKKSLVVLKLPENIASECLDRRSSRPEPELIKDDVEEQLINELSQIAEVRRALDENVLKFEDQLVANKSALSTLEYDWANKKDAIDIEMQNIALSNDSTMILFKAGATKFPAWQASLQYWTYFTSECLAECDKIRMQSVTLRGTLNNTLKKAIADIRALVDAIEKGLDKRIETLQQVVECLEEELKLNLYNLVQTENRIEDLKNSIYELNVTRKVAETRLDNRKFRVDVENTFDEPQQGLLQEINNLKNSINSLELAIVNSENVKNTLNLNRGTLEREMNLKRRALILDRDRLKVLRSHFPSEKELLSLIE